MLEGQFGSFQVISLLFRTDGQAAGKIKTKANSAQLWIPFIVNFDFGNMNNKAGSTRKILRTQNNIISKSADTDRNLDVDMHQKGVTH